MNQPAAAAPVAWTTVAKAGLACAALLLVSACGSAVAHPSTGRAVLRARPPAGVVPWVDQPAPPYSPPEPLPPPTPPPAKYAPCTAAELTGRPGVIGMGTGSYVGHPRAVKITAATRALAPTGRWSPSVAR